MVGPCTPGTPHEAFSETKLILKPGVWSTLSGEQAGAGRPGVRVGAVVLIQVGVGVGRTQRMTQGEGGGRGSFP